MANAERNGTVLEIIAEVSGTEVSALTPETELVAQLGIDSPRALQMLVQIEDRLGVEIDDREIGELHTVGDVLAVVERS